MPPHRPKRNGRLSSGGFTLLEVLVTLLLLGLAAAMVVPVFRIDPPDEGLRSVLAAARETAVRRAQAVELRVDAQGAWQLTSGDNYRIAAGRFTDGTSRLRIRVTALGACFNDGALALNIDAIGCSIDPNRSSTR